MAKLRAGPPFTGHSTGRNVSSRLSRRTNDLGPFTKDPTGLLSQILRPNVYAYDLEEWQVAYEGGDPMLIQNPHEPVCDECGNPMRFLFQFGEIIPNVQLADAGVCYV